MIINITIILMIIITANALFIFIKADLTHITIITANALFIFIKAYLTTLLLLLQMHSFCLVSLKALITTATGNLIISIFYLFFRENKTAFHVNTDECQVLLSLKK